MFIIFGATLLVLSLTVVFSLTFNFSKLFGSVYDVDSIGENIDNIKIGDSINYTVNGYSDWEVLDINKEDNTIDVVSKKSVENVMIPCADEKCSDFYDVLQDSANKYIDGEYAISARSVGEDDLRKLKTEEEVSAFWLNKKTDNLLFYSYSYCNGCRYNSDSLNITRSSKNGHIVPVVDISVSDSSVFNVGDTYSYSLNGIEEWYVLYISNSTSISIIPSTPYKTDLTTNNNGINIQQYVESEMEKYKDDIVLSVRSISSSDVDALVTIDYYGKTQINDIYTGKFLGSSSIPLSSFQHYKENLIFYNNEVIYSPCSDCGYVVSSNSYSVYAYTSGFRPVVTLKYSQEEKDGKDIKDELKIGDYVKYSANAYNNWKVLDIDKENGTVDIISGGIVKNLSLEGKEDYENLTTILQEEVDKYKVGDSVVSARALSQDDYDNLRRMKDTLSVKYFLNNKLRYRDRGEDGVFDSSDSNLVYSVGLGYYNSSISDIDYDWAILENEFMGIGTPAITGSFRYTAGLRPIITLKLYEVEKEDNIDKVEDDTNKNNELVEEQKKDNQESQKPVKNNDIKKDMIIADDTTTSDKEFVDNKDNISIDSVECDCELERDCPSVDNNDNKILILLIILNLILFILIVVLNVLKMSKKSKKIKS